MAATDRKFAWDVTVMEIGTHDILGLFTNCRINDDMATDLSRATIDTTSGGWEYNVPKERGSTIELGTVVDSTAADSHLIALAVTGGQLTVYLTRPGGSGSSACYTGTFIFTAADINFPDGAAMQGATLTAVGPIGLAAAPS